MADFSNRRGPAGLLAALLVLACAGPSAAEIYQWKDAAGRLHFAQDLNQVPDEYRAQAEAGVRKEGSGPEIQRYDGRAGRAGSGGCRDDTDRGPEAGAARERGPEDLSDPRRARAGTSMLVHVRLNDRVTAPFHIDTGASDVVIPRWVADQLELDLEGRRTGFYGTANGVVQQKLVTLESVDLGGARAENVPATVSPSMSQGLLGLSYFNHFRYDVDPVAGVVTLTPNGLVEAGVLKAGRTEDQWRRQFAQLAARREAIEHELDSINPNWTRRRDELEALVDETERQREVLEAEADEARVPMAWRD
jgi:clan AA aspartic protease (TIGR02281 family)